MNNELKEWLGIAPADFPVYFAAIAVVVIFFNKNFSIDLILSALAFFCALAACFIGMKKDPKVSDFTNSIKLAAYPLCLVTASFFIVLNFLFWNA